jgi:glutamine synthetase
MIALAPQAALWGRDNRGAMLRVIGASGDAATRIENRVGEPAANPYLYLASQIHAGLDGIERGLTAPPATDAPYAGTQVLLPTSLAEALDALQGDTPMRQAFGEDFVRYFTRIKQMERERFDQAVDKDEFNRREYFSRI